MRNVHYTIRNLLHYDNAKTHHVSEIWSQKAGETNTNVETDAMAHCFRRCIRDMSQKNNYLPPFYISCVSTGRIKDNYINYCKFWGKTCNKYLKADKKLGISGGYSCSKWWGTSLTVISVKGAGSWRTMGFSMLQLEHPICWETEWSVPKLQSESVPIFKEEWISTQKMKNYYNSGGFTSCHIIIINFCGVIVLEKKGLIVVASCTFLWSM